MINNFRTYGLVVVFCRQTKALKLPQHLKDQLLRAASSIVLNLAEGEGRASKKDQARFFNIAFASLRECQAILDIADAGNRGLGELADNLGAHMYKLIKACRGS